MSVEAHVTAEPLPRSAACDGSPLPAAAGTFGRLSDEALVGLAARSEEFALAELYGRYGAIAHGLAQRVLGDPSLAEDAVQEGFLAVWCSAARFVPERGRARTWILTLVHRRAVDLVRGARAREHHPLEFAVNRTHDLSDEALTLIEERERVRRALRGLPRDLREPLVLAYYEGMTQRELAETLGQPLGTIKSRTWRGLTRLRAALAEEDAPGAPLPSSSVDRGSEPAAGGRAAGGVDTVRGVARRVRSCGTGLRRA